MIARAPVRRAVHRLCRGRSLGGEAVMRANSRSFYMRGGKAQGIHERLGSEPAHQLVVQNQENTRGEAHGDQYPVVDVVDAHRVPELVEQACA